MLYFTENSLTLDFGFTARSNQYRNGSCGKKSSAACGRRFQIRIHRRRRRILSCLNTFYVLIFRTFKGKSQQIPTFLNMKNPTQFLLLLTILAACNKTTPEEPITPAPDQLFKSYRVDTTRSNQFIEILHYDSIQHIVEGRFQAILGDKPSWSFLPDSMKMTEGKFRLKLK